MSMNVMELYAKIGLDRSGFNKGLDAAKNALTAFGSGVSKIGGAALKVTGAAMGAAIAGVSALTKASVEGYAEYEQMVGGVKKLYGNMGQSLEEYTAYQETLGVSAEDAKAKWEKLEEAQNLVLENAKNAYKESGMSANRYMEVATSFSASLINSLEGDTVKAAEQTDKAMKAISDNWNTFGGDLGMIQNAYMAFAKQNYMLLDNLKLGYGGTKKEMERLIADANEYAKSIGLAGDMSIESFSDIIDAIDLIQQKQQIAGTTAREATTTISGSLNMLSAAWQNLVTGLSDPDADIGQLIDNVIDSAKSAIENFIPAVTRALEGIGTLVAEIAPVIGEELPSLVESLLPSLLSAATSLVQSFADALPSILNVISEQLPGILEQLLPTIVDSLVIIFTSVANMLPDLLKIISDNIDTITTGIVTIMEAVGTIFLESLPILSQAIEEGLPKVIQFIQQNIGKISSGLTTLLKAIGTLIVKLAPVIMPMVLQLGIDIIKTMAQGIGQNADELISGVMEVIDYLVVTLTDPETLETILLCGLRILEAFINGIASNKEQLSETITTLITNIIEFITNAIPDLLGFLIVTCTTLIEDVLPAVLTGIGEAIASLILKAADGISDGMITIKNKASELFGKIPEALMEGLAYLYIKISEFVGDAIDWFKGSFEKIKDVGHDLVTGLWNGIVSVKDWIIDKIGGFTDDVLSGIKSFFGISSPSKKTAVFGRYLAEGLAVGVEDEAPAAFRDIQNALDDGMNSLELDDLAMNTEFGVSKVNGSEQTAESVLGKIYELLVMMEREGLNFTLPVYIGNQPLDEMYYNSKQRLEVRSGGQVNA